MTLASFRNTLQLTTLASLTSHSPLALMILLQIGVAATFITLATQIPQAPLWLSTGGITTGVWLGASSFRFLWTKAKGSTDPFKPFAFNSFYIFLLLSSTTYSVLALDTISQITPPIVSAARPDSLPGLFNDPTAYYIATQICVTLFISLYGQTRGRVMQTAVAVQAVYLATLFEPILKTDMGATLLVGNMIVTIGYWLAHNREGETTGWRWTPFGLPMVALVIAASIATITSADTHESILITAKMAALCALTLLIINAINNEKQFWVIVIALVLPALGLAALMLYSFADLSNLMGIDFAVKHRFNITRMIPPNGVGHGVLLGFILLGGAIPLIRCWWQRTCLLVIALVMMLAILCTYSVPTCLGAGAAFTFLLVARVGWQLWNNPRRVLNWPLLAGVVATASLISALAFTPNAYSEEYRNEFTDNSTGNNRLMLWSWATTDFLENPVTGIGPTRNYETRTQTFTEFPPRNATEWGERRGLLGDDGNHWHLYATGNPHSVFVNIGETMGAIGIAAIAWLLGSLAIQGANLTLNRMSRTRWLSTISMAGASGILAWGILSQSTNIAILPLSVWPLIGLLGASYCLINKGKDDKRGKERISLAKHLPINIIRPYWHRLHPTITLIWIIILVASFLTLVARPAATQVLATQALDSKETSQAINHLELAHKLNSGDTQALSNLSLLYLKSNRLEDGISALKSLTELQTGYASNHVTLGWAYWLNGNLAGAVAEFEEAVILDPWDAQGSSNHTALALAYIASGQQSAAINSFKTSFFLAPSSAHDSSWLLLKNNTRIVDPAFYPLGDQQRLYELIRQRLSLSSTPLATPVIQPQKNQLELSTVTNQMQKEAREEILSNKQLGESMLLALTEIYQSLNLHQSALDILETLHEHKPDSSYVHYRIGLAHDSMGRLTQAETAYTKALSLATAPKRYDVYKPFSHLALGKLYHAINELELAQLHLKHAIDSYRWAYIPQAYLYLIAVEAALGNEETAKLIATRFHHLTNHTKETDQTLTALTSPQKCLNSSATIMGTPGNDILLGTNSPDVILGLDGNDLIIGLSGDDIICGGSGRDLIFGGNGNDEMDGQLGKDLIFGGNGNDTVNGGMGDDQIIGQYDSDSIFGGNGNDTIDGGMGDDTIDGGSGNDKINGRRGNDTINGGSGQDKINGRSGNDTISGGSGNDIIYGGNGNDIIDGRKGHDSITGGSGNDTISGGSGNDTLTDGNLCDGGTGDNDKSKNCQHDAGIP